MDNPNAMFAPMKKLGFPALELVKDPAKKVIKLYSDIHRTLESNSGYGLNMRQYEHSASKKKQLKIKPMAVPEEGAQASRAEKWNVPGMSSYGHYINDLHSPTSHRPVPPNNQFRPTATQWPPAMLSVEDRDHLLELYYTHVHPQMPLLDQVTMQYQLNICWVSNFNECYLSPLFFCAMFANVARYSDRPQVQSRTDEFMELARAFRDNYYGYASVSSILALILMAEAEQSRKQPHVAYAWLLAGESFRMTMELGLQRSCNVSHSPADRELAVRTFWTAFTTDRLMSMTYGRPFVFEEKDIEMPMPMLTDSEKKNFPQTKQYLKNFATLIDISKVVGRIIRFNYSAQAVQMRGPSLHQEAMLSTLDSWVASMIKEAMNCPPQQDPFQRRFEEVKQLMLHTLLILLHQPHVDNKEPNAQKKNGISMPSFEIATYSALIITERVSELSYEDLEHIIKRSSAVYTILIAMRVHLMNASYEPDQEYIRNGEISFLRSMAVLEKAQHHLQQGILFSTTIGQLQNQFVSRTCPILAEYADKIKHGSGSSAPIFAGYDFIPSPSPSTPNIPGSSVLITEHRSRPPKATRAGPSRSIKNKDPQFYNYRADGKGKLTPHRQSHSKSSASRRKRATSRSTESPRQSSSTQLEIQQVSPNAIYPSHMEAVPSAELSPQSYYSFVEHPSEPVQQQQMVSPDPVPQQTISVDSIQQQMVSVDPIQHQASQYSQANDLYEDPTFAFIQQITQSMGTPMYYTNAPAPGTQMATNIPPSTYGVAANSMVDSADAIHTYIVGPWPEMPITDGSASFDTTILDTSMYDATMFSYGNSTSSA